MSRFQVTINKTEFVRPSESFNSKRVLWYLWRDLPFFRILTNKLSKDKIYIDKSNCLTTPCYFVDRETCQGKTLMWWHKEQKTNWWNNKMRELSETILIIRFLCSGRQFLCWILATLTISCNRQPTVWDFENFLLT